MEKMKKYFSKHLMYTSLVHAIGGLGVGILIARPYVTNPVKWGWGLILLAILGHIYAYFAKK